MLGLLATIIFGFIVRKLYFTTNPNITTPSPTKSLVNTLPPHYRDVPELLTVLPDFQVSFTFDDLPSVHYPQHLRGWIVQRGSACGIDKDDDYDFCKITVDPSAKGPYTMKPNDIIGLHAHTHGKSSFEADYYYLILYSDLYKNIYLTQNTTNINVHITNPFKIERDSGDKELKFQSIPNVLRRCVDPDSYNIAVNSGQSAGSGIHFPPNTGLE